MFWPIVLMKKVLWLTWLYFFVLQRSLNINVTIIKLTPTWHLQRLFRAMQSPEYSSVNLQHDSMMSLCINKFNTLYNLIKFFSVWTTLSQSSCIYCLLINMKSCFPLRRCAFLRWVLLDVTLECMIFCRFCYLSENTKVPFNHSYSLYSKCLGCNIPLSLRVITKQLLVLQIWNF